MFDNRTEKKQPRNILIQNSKKQLVQNDSINLLQNSYISKQVQRNQNFNYNINAQLITNYNQIKQLLNHRKVLLRSKHQSMISKNREKVQSIAYAREQDLKNEAKLLNDRQIIDLVEHSQSLSKSKSLMMQISEIKNMNNYQAEQRNSGKKFWDKHKEIQRQRRKKSENYAGQSKKLMQLNHRERIIFGEIQNYQNQIFLQCTSRRNDPAHIKRAQKFNQQIQKRKNALRELKIQKSKIKSSILNIIDQILTFNEVNEKIYKSRFRQLDQIFAGSGNLAQFDSLMNSLQKIITSKNVSDRGQNPKSMNQNLGQLIKDFDNIIQQLDRMKQDQDMIFGFINAQLKEQVKNAIIEKAFLSNFVVKSDQSQLLRKVKQYRRLLFDLSEQRPRLQQIINKVNRMSSVLYPIKKSYGNEDVRRQELKRQIKKLFAINMEIESKQKQHRNFRFDMEELMRKKQSIEAEINQYAEKANLTQYKNKMKQLEIVNKKISQKNDQTLYDQIMSLKSQLQNSFIRLQQNFQDLILQVQVQEQRNNLGVFLTKIQKRLSLV